MIRYMKLSDITIPVGFQAHPPAKYKIDLCRDYLEEFDELDRKIIVSPDGVLLDGYVAYLVLQEAGWDGIYAFIHDAPITKKDYRYTETTYIAGVHGGQKREFWWRMTAKTENPEFAIPGNKAIVYTKYGPTPITITQVLVTSTPPVEGIVKKVVCCFPDRQKELIEDE